ncbi:MAG: MFS transporter [Actinomycetota bacterium]
MCLALVAVVASVSGLNVALNELSVELGASTSALLWVVNAYTLTMAALLLPIGELGDRIGRRSILIAGLGVFAVANGLATTADSAGIMTAYRVLAGVGAAMIMPATLSTLTSVFPAEERGRAVGIWAGFAGAGGVLGLFSSSILIDYASWQWLFVVPIVAAVIALVATVTIVPNTRSTDTHRIDLVGGALSALAVGGIVLGVHEGPEVGWTEPITLLGLVGGAIAAVGYVSWSRRQEHPLLDVAIFRDRKLAAGSFSLLMLFALIFGVFLVVIQYLQAVLGFSAVRSAAGLLPMAAMMMGLSPVAPQISDRIGFSRILAAGSVLLTGGFIWLATATSDPSYYAILPGLVLLGAGVGLAMSPATTAITDALPAEKQGVASALNDTVREFGSALGVALIGSVLSAGYRSDITSTTETLPEELAHPVEEGIGQAMAVAGQLGADGEAIGQAARDAFLSGWSLAMIVAAVTAAIAGGMTAAMFRGNDVPADERDLALAA